MHLHKLAAITKKSKRRLGRGSGSGREKTSGRGTKGQKARGSISPGFEGGQLRLLKRMPFNRGKNRNDSFKAKPYVVNVSLLNAFADKSTVTIEALVKNNLVPQSALKTGVKILGSGELNKKLTVMVPFSKGAQAKIEAKGGSVSSSKKPPIVSESKEKIVKKKQS